MLSSELEASTCAIGQSERNERRRMGRMRRAIVGDHFVCIAVIGGNERETTLGLHRFNNLRNARINRLDECE